MSSYWHRQMNKSMNEGEFLAVEFQLTNIEEMMESENHHYVATTF